MNSTAADAITNCLSAPQFLAVALPTPDAPHAGLISFTPTADEPAAAGRRFAASPPRPLDESAAWPKQYAPETKVSTLWYEAFVGFGGETIAASARRRGKIDGTVNRSGRANRRLMIRLLLVGGFAAAASICSLEAQSLPSASFLELVFAPGVAPYSTNLGSVTGTSVLANEPGTATASISIFNGTLTATGSFSGYAAYQSGEFWAESAMDLYFKVTGATPFTTIPLTLTGSYSGVSDVRPGLIGYVALYNGIGGPTVFFQQYTDTQNQSFSLSANPSAFVTGGSDDVFHLQVFTLAENIGAGQHNGDVSLSVNLSVDADFFDNNPGVFIMANPELNFSANSVPEPATWTLLAGCLTLAVVLSKKLKGRLKAVAMGVNLPAKEMCDNRPSCEPTPW